MTSAAEASVALPDRPPITLRLLASEKSLIIEAWDHIPRDLEPREPNADDECGRGLTVVAALSDRWGNGGREGLELARGRSVTAGSTRHGRGSAPTRTHDR
jgi:hypothetical protein